MVESTVQVYCIFMSVICQKVYYSFLPIILNLKHKTTCRKKKNLSQHLACAAAFKYPKFSNLDDALKWYNEHQTEMFTSDESFIQFAAQASDPFFFIAKILSQDEGVSNYHQVPVTQDASASAYQIMSYLLLNLEMGRRTNLLPS